MTDILHSVTQNAHLLPLTFDGKNIILIMTHRAMESDIHKSGFGGTL